MKQSFLDSLKGLTTKEAGTKCLRAGYNVKIYERDDIIMALAIPDTINLWEENDVVVETTAGDPLQVEEND